jgi:hypothetical protein
MSNRLKRKGSTRSGVVRTTISLPLVLNELYPAIIQRAGYCGLSDYVQAQIRRDAGLDPVVTTADKR